MEEIKAQLKETTKRAFRELGHDVEVDDIDIVESEEGKGDFSSKIAFREFKRLGYSSAYELVEKLQDKINRSTPALALKKVQGVEPGHLNFYVLASTWASYLPEVLDPDYGRNQVERPERVNVEFISANPTGPLTLGNGRGGYGGDVLANILSFLGHEVTREYYINDSGAQTDKLVASVFPDSGRKEAAEYQGGYISDLRDHFSSPPGDPRVLTDHVLGSLIRPAIGRMGIEFDVWTSEYRDLHQPGKVGEMLVRLEEAGLTYERDGATWLATSRYGDSRDRIVVKSEGEVTYLLVDLAYHWNKFAEQGFERGINLWGADHAGQVPSLQAGLRALDHEGRLDVVIFQLVRLIKGGEEYKMSKRAGTYVTMDDLLDEIGGEHPEEVARWFFISRSHDTHMDFDLDLARERSEKNPIYYVQYAHARVRGILRQAGEQSEGSDGADLSVLTEPEETELIKRLLAFPGMVKEAGSGPEYPVHKLAFYAGDLATVFHKFYHERRVLEADGPVREARLALVKATGAVLRRVLAELVGVRAPEKM